jgi:riboflavin biosynthesis pyrimidine reductase
MGVPADGEILPAVIAEHVAVPLGRAAGRALVRLNMITSADGGSELAGRSGGLGDRNDEAVFAALRGHADAVVVGLSTVVSEHYHPPGPEGVEIFVVSSMPDVSGDAELFASDRVTLVLPEGAAAPPAGVRTLMLGAGGRVDLEQLVATLEPRVVMVEGGPTLAGEMLALGLIDEFFLTIAPRVISGSSARIVHGPDADPTAWTLAHSFIDGDGFVFLRYARPER